MKLLTIPKSEYNNYRLDVIFDGYKWDPQYMDNNTIAKFALVLTEEEHNELIRLTEDLDKETIQAETLINENLKLAKPLSLPRKIRKELKSMKNYDANRHIRLMRYDFHPTIDGGWALSEVNSDVPGGLAEASLMPQIALGTIGEKGYNYENFSEALASAIKQKVKPGGKIMFVHCTSYSDDRQVMQLIGDKLETMGYKAIYGAADHLRFENTEAISELEGNTGIIDAIIRFTPLEWLVNMKPKRWGGYFDTTTVSCNHPIAIFAQTKRFPLVWETLEKHGVELSTWRKLLPETIEVKDVKNRDGYIFKPIYGRVGERISIKEACRDDEYDKIIKDVKKNPKKYLAQKMFDSRPLISDDGESFHVCLGSYSVEGKAAGYYARISKTPRIDSSAADIPVLIESSSPKKDTEKTITTHPHRQEQENTAISFKEAFELWAPAGCKWVQWVRPVPFVQKIPTDLCTVTSCDLTPVCYLEQMAEDTAIFIDLPGYESINEGLALAKLGWRPIPLYNGANEQHGAMALVDNHGIEKALQWGAVRLKSIKLAGDAPPVFLLDSNRLQRYRMDVSVFDNSWDLFEQDIPSPECFINNGISKIIIRGEKINKDISRILYKFQTKGITILFTKGYEAATEIKLKKPPRRYNL